MRIQQKPILHGRDHLPGHPDPIPGLSTGTPGDFNAAVVATSDLYAYWRLGETAGPWADTSGVGTPADLTEQDTGTALTPDVTGALPGSQDDGAVEFNYDGHADGGRYLFNNGSSKSFEMTGGVMSVCAWVKVKASADSRRGEIIGNVHIASPGGNHYAGWGLEVVYPGRTVRFTRGQVGGFGQPELYAETAGGVVAGEWNFFVGTYDGTDIKLYANGALVDTAADASGVAASSFDNVWVGYGLEVDGFVYSWLYGTVDEAAIWTRALTADEITALYTAGVNAASPDGDQVLISDGAGGFHWGQANGNAIADEAIVNRHVATGADIDVLKLAHPGGTSTFLRADGTWAAPAGGTTVVTDTVWDAKGDLAAGTGADTAARLAVGTNGYVLTADSTQTTGVKWAAAPAGDPATQTQAWMPLVDSDGLCVLDSGDTLIPTLITL